VLLAIQDVSYSSLLVPSNRNFAKLVTVNDASTLSTSESSQSSQGILARTFFCHWWKLSVLFQQFCGSYFILSDTVENFKMQ